MSKSLVIVESPGKIKKISEYLGNDYIVKASFGHCMDLDPNNLSIDVNNNFKPTYIVSPDKSKIVHELKTLASKYNVIIATDEDREGEAIGWSLANLLKLNNPQRIVFHEITKKAINNAINNPSVINMDMVHAQQARRLLDRLVGYKISPILQKSLSNTNAKSAGRVQSVVVRIIKEKEDEINNCIESSYLKSSIELSYNNNKINASLMTNNDYYKFNNINDAKNLLQLINKDTIFKIINIDYKSIIRKPSYPFITSTLQQEASTKLKFNIKKTSMVAQKLYEGGYITYMRTDSPNLSEEAIAKCKDFIINTYGENYSHPKVYKSKNSQEAHEAIRPTNINNNTINVEDNDMIKLYDLIWKRTIASQMSYAEIKSDTIFIDTINQNSILPKDTFWTTTFENIIFDGYLIVYNNIEDDENDTIIKNKKNKLKVNDILDFQKIKVSQEYNKLPLRFNEANLVKYLEKHQIGRPSTYASIITKILDRSYVEIKNIEGTKKISNELEYNKKFEFKEKTKEVILGKEHNKIVPTELGITITDFLLNNFNVIMEIDFTAEFETYLDKIAKGEAQWYNVLDKFYKMFNPIVEQLNKNIITEKETLNIIGKHPDLNVDLIISNGKYGPYVKYKNNEKWVFTAIPSLDTTYEEIINLIQYPKFIGKIDKKHVYLCKGNYGLYLKYNERNYSINNDDNIDIEKAKLIISNVYPKIIGKIDKKNVELCKGQYGLYLKYNGRNYSLSNIKENENIDINFAINIINSKKNI